MAQPDTLGELLQLPRAMPGAALLRHAVDSANDVVLILDTEDLDGAGLPRIVYANATLERQTGYKPQDVIGRSSQIFFGPDTDRSAVGTLQTRSRTRQPISVEMVNYRKDGSPYWVEVNSRPVSDAGGKITHWISVRHDITRRKQTEEALRGSEERYRLLFENSPNSMMVYDLETLYFVAVNDAAVKHYGYSTEEFLSMTVKEIRPQEDLAKFSEVVLRQPRPGTYSGAWRHRKRDGSIIDVEVAARSIVWEGRLARLVLVTDITERNRAEAARREAETAVRESESRLAAAQEFAHLGSWETDLRTGDFHGSGELYRIYGLSPSAVPSSPPRFGDFVYPEDRERVKHAVEGAKAKGGSYEVEHRIVLPDSSVKYVFCQGRFICSDSGEPIKVVGTVLDITQRKEAQERVSYLYQHDLLTGLPNRALFTDRLAQAILHARRSGRCAAVFYVELNRFEQMTETLEYAIRNDLINAVAKRLAETVRSVDTVARVGGNGFAIVLGDIGQPEDAVLAGRKLLATFDDPFEAGQLELRVTSGIGISIYPLDGADADTLIRNAEIAMVQARANGDNTLRLFTPAMNELAAKRFSLEADLRQALDEGELVIYYQPFVAPSGKIVGAEALSRWRHPTRGLLLPAEFISLAENTGLISTLGQQVLHQACTQIKAWNDAGHGSLRIAVNVSPHQFRQDDLVRTVERTLHTTGLRPEFLELELTENAVMQDIGSGLEVLRTLKKRGIRLSLDDFGTGYSSLSHLKQFPIDALKIDRSFVRNITTDAFDHGIADTIITLGHNLGLRVVAEGVETMGQWRRLRQLHCDEMQGFLFSPPLPANGLERLLKYGTLQQPRWRTARRITRAN